MATVSVKLLETSARSPDLNPIEHVWDEMGRRLRRHVPGPRNWREFRDILVQEWENLPQDVIQNLIQSMPRRLQAVITARGGNTRYRRPSDLLCFNLKYNNINFLFSINFE